MRVIGAAGTVADTMQTVNAPAHEPIRLTQFAQGGGCGCKIAPSLLREILARAPQGTVPPERMAGTETSDDAAVCRLNEGQALATTTDFVAPDLFISAHHQSSP